jgi:hypothetical protein
MGMLPLLPTAHRARGSGTAGGGVSDLTLCLLDGTAVNPKLCCEGDAIMIGCPEAETKLARNSRVSGTEGLRDIVDFEAIGVILKDCGDGGGMKDCGDGGL